MQPVVWLSFGWVLVAAACGAGSSALDTPPGSTVPPPPSMAGADVAEPTKPRPSTTRSAPVASAPDPGPTGAGIERIRTGQAEPTLVVVNAYPKRQHVLIDGQHVGDLPPAASATLEVAVGVHTVTCADDPDGEGNPSSITETFETGYQYRYEIRPR